MVLQKIREQYNSWFIKNKESIIIKEKNTNNLIDTFLEKYTKASIQNMELDDYVEGKRNKDSFCYWIERKLSEAGSIRGVRAGKLFGIYFAKKINEYKIQTPKFNSNPVLAFEQIKKEIIRVIDASKNHDIKAITNSKLSDRLRNKISYLYNRNDYLPIYSKTHIDKLLKFFLITGIKKDESIESKKNKVFKFYKILNLYKCSPLRFMYFIYDEYRDKLFGKSESKSIKSKEIGKFECDEKLRSEKNFINQIYNYDQEYESKNNKELKRHKIYEGQELKKEVIYKGRNVTIKNAYLRKKEN